MEEEAELGEARSRDLELQPPRGRFPREQSPPPRPSPLELARSIIRSIIILVAWEEAAAEEAAVKSPLPPLLAAALRPNERRCPFRLTAWASPPRLKRPPPIPSKVGGHCHTVEWLWRRTNRRRRRWRARHFRR